MFFYGVFNRVWNLSSNIIDIAREHDSSSTDQYVLLRARTEVLPSASTLFATTSTTLSKWCPHCGAAEQGARHFLFTCDKRVPERREHMGKDYIHAEEEEFLSRKPKQILNFIKATEIFEAETTRKIGASFPAAEAATSAKVDVACGEMADAIEEQGLIIRLNEDPRIQLSDGESDSDDE